MKAPNFSDQHDSSTQHYASTLVTEIRSRRKTDDPRKRDLAPTLIQKDSCQFLLARHFGFCFGVDNAVEVAYRALAENPLRRIFLVSEMIHNPAVNRDLAARGIKFLRSTNGEELIPLKELSPEDIIIIPAFGAPLAIMQELENLNLTTQHYDATCPFVEKVWRRAAQLGKEGFSLVVHGKGYHEETRATFSRVAVYAQAGIVVKTVQEVDDLCQFIETNNFNNETPQAFKERFYQKFSSKITENFDPTIHLQKLGVINQTTMLAEETREVGKRIRQALIYRYGLEQITNHFADTRDTLCYATSENQAAVKELLNTDADCAFVVGGHNSSNTANLATLLRSRFPTFHIRDENDILSKDQLIHLATSGTAEVLSDWIPKQIISDQVPLKIALTAGASTPDSTIEAVIKKMVEIINK